MSLERAIIMTAVAAALFCRLPSSAAAGHAEVAAGASEEALARVLWQHSPELAGARRELVEAEAAGDRARLFPNPTLSATWSTLPIGPRNPPGISFWDVPSYGLAVGETFEIGKRGPRRRAADAGAAASRLELEEVFRRAFLELLSALADQAEAMDRARILRRLVERGAESLELQRARAERGDVAAIDVERLEVEHGRLRASVREADAAAAAASARCGAILGRACPPLAEEGAARRFLQQLPPGVDGVPAAVGERPDLRALSARAAQAEEEATLASRRAIPDPALTVAIQHDRFVVAGNQADSVSLGLSVPLPVFDRGQVDAARARRVRRIAEDARAALAASATDAIAAGRRRIAALAERVRDLEQDVIPRARVVLERMEAAARRGGVALPDVLLARRALEEVQLDLSGAIAERYRAVLDVRRAAGIGPPLPGGAGQ